MGFSLSNSISFRSKLLSSASSVVTPQSLFANGEEGAWLEFVDGQVFTDTAGTTAATLDDGAGFVLDLSQGAGYSGGEFTGLGPELVTDGTFDVDLSGWEGVSDASIEYASGRAKVTLANVSGSGIRSASNVLLDAGALYAVSADVEPDDFSGSSVTLSLLGQSVTGIPIATSGVSRIHAVIFSASGSNGTTVGVLRGAAGQTGSYFVDNISVRKLPGNRVTQSDPNKEPLFKDPGVEFDGVDDAIDVTIPAGGITGQMYYASSAGKGVFGVDFAAGTRTFGTLNWRNTLHALIFMDRDFTASEASGLDSRFDGVAGDFDTLVDGNRLFRSMGLTHIVEGYEWTNLEEAVRMWGDNDLQEIPTGMKLPNLVNGSRMFRRNPNLAIVPSDFAQDSDCTDWDRAFEDTGLTQQSIDNVLVNLAARGTSNGSFEQSGGSAPSATGEAAIDDLRSRGWTITVTGGY